LRLEIGGAPVQVYDLRGIEDGPDPDRLRRPEIKGEVCVCVCV
jgi:hypothetical protein